MVTTNSKNWNSTKKTGMSIWQRLAIKISAVLVAGIIVLTLINLFN